MRTLDEAAGAVPAVPRTAAPRTAAGLRRAAGSVGAGVRSPGRVPAAAPHPLPTESAGPRALDAGARPGPVAQASSPAGLAGLAAVPVTARRALRPAVRPWRRLSPDEPGPSRTAA
ncbi:hypothetical protein [Streptomyces sp. NPDC003719]